MEASRVGIPHAVSARLGTCIRVPAELSKRTGLPGTRIRVGARCLVSVAVVTAEELLGVVPGVLSDVRRGGFGGRLWL